MSERKEFRLLLLGGGRRNGLVRAFRAAAGEHNLEFSCLAYESSLHVPVALEAEVIVGLHWENKGIIDELSNLVVDRKIDWICACVDQATQLLEAVRDAVLPNLLTSSSAACANMLDKEVANSIAVIAGLVPIPLFNKLPAFVKPRRGSASRNSRLVESNEELRHLLARADKCDLMCQMACSGPEYTVDCFAANEIIHASPRVRIQTSGGEAIVSQTVDRKDLVDMSVSFIRTAGLLGPLTIQFIEHEDRVFFMECNPRFGGGVLCSIKRGFNYPLTCLAAALQRPRPVFSEKANVKMCRYFAEVYFAADN